MVAVLLSLTLVAAACGGDDNAGDGPGTDGHGGDDRRIDYEALGLWDDGPCDAVEPAVIGLMTVFESPVLSLEEPRARRSRRPPRRSTPEAAPTARASRSTRATTAPTLDQSMACVREIDDAGVVATVNDLGTAGQAEVSAAMAKAGIPRIGSNVSNQDWGDQNAYPLDASGTGFIFLMPQGLIEEGVDKIGIVRVDLAAASALQGLLADIYEGEATFPVDLPVPAGTTDYTQFILAAEDAGAEGVALALGEQEGLQVVRAGQQLGTDLLIGSSLSTLGARDRRRAGRLRRPGGVPPLVPAGDLRPPGLRGAPRRPLGVGRGVAPAREPAGHGDAVVDRSLRAALDDPGHGDDRVHPRGRVRDAERGHGRPDAGHLRRRELDAVAQPPGDLPASRHQPLGRLAVGPRGEGAGRAHGNFVEGAEINFDEVLCGTPARRAGTLLMDRPDRSATP